MVRTCCRRLLVVAAIFLLIAALAVRLTINLIHPRSL